MHPILGQNVYFVKEHAGMFKAANSYDILDPNDQTKVLMECREPNLGFFTKFFRFTEYKTMTPFDVHVTAGGKQVIRVNRGVVIFRSHVTVFDDKDQKVGGFRQKWFSFGGAFTVLGPNDEPLCDLKGKWTGWDFKFIAPNGQVLAQVSKQWAGLAKELFTTADNYVLSIDPSVPKDSLVRQLILGAVLCIDMVLKE